LSGEKTVLKTDEDRGGLRNVVFSPLNHLTQLTARENLIILSRRESNKSHFLLFVSSSL